MKLVQISSVPFPYVNAATFDLYFHGCDIDYGHGYKENFKDTFYHQRWNNNVKEKEKKNVVQTSPYKPIYEVELSLKSTF